MKAIAPAIFAIAIGLAIAIPLLSPKILGGVALGLALTALTLIALRAFGAWSRPARVAAVLLCLAEGLFFILVAPLGPRFRYNQSEVTLLLVMIATTAFLHFGAQALNAWAGRTAGWLRGHRWAEGLVISAFTILLLAGAAEFLASALARTRLIPFDRPLQTFHRGQPVADWRRFHITADRHRIPDPYLLWRPVAFNPYNSMGYKAPEFAAAKPAGIFRIIALGDSNTDGPDRGGWPDELRRLLNAPANPGRRFEVLNGGVVGYSSFQGLRRLEESLGYSPDLVTVSFGANDAHLVTAADKEFAMIGPVLRLFFRYKAFLLARYVASRLRHSMEVAPESLRPRVSLEEYEANLEKMVALARAAGAAVVFLTRPFDPTRHVGATRGSWSERAHGYNAATIRLGRRLGVPVFDAYALFEHSGPNAFADDSHFNLLGHARMALLLRDFLLGEGMIPTTPRGPGKVEARS